MTTVLHANDFLPWSDPADLLGALARLGREPIPALRDAIEGLLGHRDPDVREEALRVLVTRWKVASLREHAAKALRTDEEVAVRMAAAFAVASVSTVETRSEDSALLIGVVGNDSEHQDVRGAAYDALLIVHRRAAFPDAGEQFDPRRDVDWGWVESLRRGTR